MSLRYAKEWTLAYPNPMGRACLDIRNNNWKQCFLNAPNAKFHLMHNKKINKMEFGYIRPFGYAIYLMVLVLFPNQFCMPALSPSGLAFGGKKSCLIERMVLTTSCISFRRKSRVSSRNGSYMVLITKQHTPIALRIQLLDIDQIMWPIAIPSI